MLVFLFCLFTKINSTNSFSIFCGPGSSIEVKSSYYSEVTLMNPPNSTYAFIGKEGSDPFISYDRSLQTYNYSLDYYSLDSYLNQSNKLNLPIFQQPKNITFSICVLDSNTADTPVLSLTQFQYNCSLNCSRLNGVCINNTCTCKGTYFGSNCNLFYHNITWRFFKNFTSPAYSFTFFRFNKDLKIYLKNYNDLHRFHEKDNSTVPSFFQFFNYTTANHLYYSNGTTIFYSVFCPVSSSCSFTMSEGLSSSYNYTELIIVLCTVGGLVILLVVVLVISVKIRSFLAARRNQVRRNFEIEKLAPKIKWRGNNENDTCSICLVSFNIDEEIRLVQNCSHVFHIKCLDEWIHQKEICPNCNQDIHRV